MAKNMTRKGLAFGAAVALGATGIAASPATAVGMPDNSLVSLLPNSGTAYTVFTDSVFDIDANFASSVLGTGKDLKFRITDGSDLVKVDIAHDSAGDTEAATTLDGTADTIAITAGATAADFDVIAIDVDTGAGSGLIAGDAVTLANLADPEADATKQAKLDAIEGTHVVHNVSGDVITIRAFTSVTADLSAEIVTGTMTEITESDALDSRGDILAANLGGAGLISTAATVVDTRSTDDFIVVDSNEDNNVADVTLRLVVDTAETYSVTVVAWVDNNDNDKIDATEYASPERVVTFKKASEIVPSLTFEPILVGDGLITATVSTEPKINFDMVGDSAFTVDFQRQGSALTVQTSGYSESWSDTDSEYTVTQRINNTTSADNWSDITLPTVSNGTYGQSGTTVTVVAANTLSVNDVISVTTHGVATSKKVTSASPLGFTYTADASATVAAGTAFTGSNVTVNSYAYAVAGLYKATVKVGTTPTKIGSTFETSAGVAVAASVRNVATVTADVNSAFQVRAGYKDAVTVTSTVRNSKGVAVAAGIPVSIAVSETSAGTITVNGLAVAGSRTIPAVTDANGQVVITVTNSAAAANDTVTLNVTSQGFSDSDTLTWQVPTFSLSDASDPASTDVLVRSILAGGTVSFNLEVKDQFNAFLTGEARVKVALAGTRWSATTYEALASGKATINVADVPVNVSDLSGEVTFTLQQKNTFGSWVDSNGTAGTSAVADGAGEINGDAVTVNIRSANGTTVSLNGDAVDSADLAALVAQTATVASDVRNAETPSDFSTDSGDVTATITGNVLDAFTGLAQPGSAVTISGDSNILFRVGDVSAFGTLTVYSDASTARFSVQAFSNMAMKDSVVTVTSNGASSTTKLTFTGSAAATAWNMDAVPYVVQAGYSFSLSAKLLDKYGNPVDTASGVKVAWDGPVLTVPNDLTSLTQTDANGVVKFGVMPGANEVGSYTLVVQYAGADGIFDNADDISAQRTVVIGTLGNVGPLAAWTSNQNDGTVKVYAKNIVGAGKVRFMFNGKEIAWVNAADETDPKLRTKNGAGYLVRTVSLVEGKKNVIEIWVDGERVARTAYSY